MESRRIHLLNMFNDISGRREIEVGELVTFKNIAGHGDVWVGVRWLWRRKRNE